LEEERGVLLLRMVLLGEARYFELQIKQGQVGLEGVLNQRRISKK